jgi:hypothetical protein
MIDGPAAVRWFEQPCARDDLESAATFQRRLGADAILCGDESICTLDDLDRAARAGAFRAVNIRIAKHGGLVATLDVYDSARSAGLEAQIGCLVGESSVLSYAGLHLASIAGPAALPRGLLRPVPVHAGRHPSLAAIRSRGSGAAVCAARCGARPRMGSGPAPARCQSGDPVGRAAVRPAAPRSVRRRLTRVAVRARADWLRMQMRRRVARYPADQLALAERYRVRDHEPRVYDDVVRAQIERAASACREPYELVMTSGTMAQPKQLLYPLSRARALQRTYMRQVLLACDHAGVDRLAGYFVTNLAPDRSLGALLARVRPPRLLRLIALREAPCLVTSSWPVSMRREICRGHHAVGRQVQRQQPRAVQAAPAVSDVLGNPCVAFEGASSASITGST